MQVLRFQAEDRLSLAIFQFDTPYSPKAELDSYEDSRVDDADRNVRAAAGELILDVDASYQRVTGDRLPFGDQHLVPLNTTSFDVDQLV